uniref:Cleavage stimulation factor subunit 1 dimerisation domain-containing protein n=1 Tax=Amphimedon queenslandica TaxID=400682 RepID=A0A1X7SFA0_AMPQE
MEATGSVKEREHLYRLIVSQLRYDGYESAASNLARNFSAYPPCAPSSRLSHLVRLGNQMEGE